MWKEKVKGGLILLGIQTLLGLCAGIYIHQNYLQLTKEKSKTEKLPEIRLDILKGNINENQQLEIENNKYKYKGIFGEIDVSKEISGKQLFNFNKTSKEKIYINKEQIYKYCVLNKYLKNKYIDIFIYDYFKNQGIQKFQTYLDNVIKVDNYLDIKYTDNIVNNEICGLEKIRNYIINKDYLNLINYLKLLEKKNNLNYSNPGYNRRVINLDFFESQEFQYLINTFIIDKNGLYKKHIDEVSKLLSIDYNLINAAILTEQVRGFFTNRGVIKDIIKTNKLIMVMSQFSYGIGGIKEKTAIKIEEFLKHNYNEIYEKHISGLIENNERISKLTNDYFIQTLYVGSLIKSIIEKRKVGGHPIEDDIGVIMTLYNYGNPENKQPHENPQIGGAVIELDGKEYSFGALGTIFYYYLEFYY